MSSTLYNGGYDWYAQAETYPHYDVINDETDLAEFRESSIIEEKTRPQLKPKSTINRQSHTQLYVPEQSRTPNHAERIRRNLRILRDLSAILAIGGMFVFSFAITRSQYEMSIVGLFATVGFSAFFTQSNQLMKESAEAGSKGSDD